MAADGRLWKLGNLNELRHREFTLLQEQQKAASGEVAQCAHSVEDPGFDQSIHKSGLKDITLLAPWQGPGVVAPLD